MKVQEKMKTAFLFNDTNHFLATAFASSLAPILLPRNLILSSLSSFPRTALSGIAFPASNSLMMMGFTLIFYFKNKFN